jgi:hypothetical protein
MLRVYGKDVIEHDRNKMLTCSLRCNALVQVTNNPVERELLAREIQEAIDAKQ